MSRPRTMGAGLAGSMTKKVNVNQIQFGDKLQGLAPSATQFFIQSGRGGGNYYRTRTHGNNRNIVFCMNQLGGVGRGKSQFKIGGLNKPDGVSNSCSQCGATAAKLFCAGGGGNQAFCAYVNKAGFRCPYPCPKKSYATEPVHRNSSTVSFPNLTDETGDTLTIPVQPYTDITALIKCGEPTAVNLVKKMIVDGRQNACTDNGICSPQPRAQCFHLPGAISVDWLHLHTLNEPIPSELFPCIPGFNNCPLTTKDYVCISSNQGSLWDNPDVAARTIIQQATKSITYT